ncbi:MAG TPA: transcription antitermination factor NusB [Firmicutes bacterium]|nr:transcription antitermination factor NusB [Bacillota bacterium]
MTRREVREVALKALYQVDIARTPVKDALKWALLSGEGKISAANERFLTTLVSGAAQHLESIDKIISRFARGWTIERMGSIDRNVLRLAIYEMLYMNETSPGVAINEAVELAKKYGDQDSGRFVNGILASVARNIVDNEERLDRPRDDAGN